MKSPSSYAPTVSLERATARRNVVLQAMLDLARSMTRRSKGAGKAPTLHDGLRQEEPTGSISGARAPGTRRAVWLRRVYQGGLRVFTTIDLNMQKSAETAVANGLKSIEAKRRALAERRKSAGRRNTGADEGDSGEPLQGALVALDPQTGHIRAMVGGRDFAESPFNRAVQAERQPGSAFKPFVYAAALESGFTPATMIGNLDTPIATVQGAWTPEDEHSTAPELSLRTALRTSSNRAAVQPSSRWDRADRAICENMGVGNLPSVPSLALGSGEVTQESMTAAYATFANHGRVPRPLAIRRVEDQDGRVLYTGENVSTYAISDITAFQMTNMMAEVINAGTGATARALGFKLPAAGKTGTTNDFNDAWFVGFTPKLAAGVWVGFDQPQTILPNGFAAITAVPVWAEAATRATPEWSRRPAAWSRRGRRLRQPARVRSVRLSRDATSSTGRWCTRSTSRPGPSRPMSAICTRRAASSTPSRPCWARTSPRRPLSSPIPALRHRRPSSWNRRPRLRPRARRSTRRKNPAAASGRASSDSARTKNRSDTMPLEASWPFGK